MTILILTHSYPDINNTWRGSFIRDQARLISNNNIVAVVFFRVDYKHFGPFSRPQISKTSAGNLTEYTITVRKSLPVINQINYLVKTFRFINKEIIGTCEPDLIHCQLSYPGGFLGTIIQKKKHIPAIVTEHSRIATYYRSWFHKQCIKYTLRNAAGLIAVSNTLKTEILSVSDRAVSVIHNFVDVEKFELTKRQISPILNIGFLGGLGNNNKGLDLLLKSVSLFKKQSYIVHIGGKGILLESYIKMAQDLGIDSYCKFYGDIPREEISDFYSKIDIFVLPSRYETFGIVLIEAMACGIPVIATKCGGPEEIVTKSTGILIEKENTSELTTALDCLSEDLRLYDKELIRKYVTENFGQKVFIERISSLYKKILTK